MKKLNTFSLLTAMAVVIFGTSCKDDGPTVGGGGGNYKVADGIYIASVASTDTTVNNGWVLNATNVETDGFATKPRTGYLTGFVYLEAGSYVFGEVDGQEFAKVYGGTASEFNDDSGDNTDGYTGSYTVVKVDDTSTSSVSVANAGMYLVTFDTQTMEALIVPIVDWGIIGGGVFTDACSSNGFNADVDIDESSSSATAGATYSATGVILKNGEFKFRFNDNWKIDRRTNQASYDDVNGYVVLTNLGGSSITALEAGGGNIPVNNDGAATVNGVYDLSFTIDADGLIAISMTKTEDAPECAFNPDNYSWGIIGAGTYNAWGSDTKLSYSLDGSTHIWRGVFPLNGGAADNSFKFRTDDTWANKLLPTNVTVTDNTDNGQITDDGDVNADGQWFVADGYSGFYYFEVKTADQGATWTMTIDEAVFSVIGTAVGGWNPENDQNLAYSDDFTGGTSSASASGSVTMIADEYKFRVNGSWDYNLGGELAGLTLGGANFVAPNSATYTVTITTADGGATYTATVVQ